MNFIFPFSPGSVHSCFLSRSLSFQLRKSDWDLLDNCLLVGELATEHRKVHSLPPRLISLFLQCYQLGKLEVQDGDRAWVQFLDLANSCFVFSSVLRVFSV